MHQHLKLCMLLSAGTSGTGTVKCGQNGLPSCAGGNSDPVMYGFAGRSFNFMGEVGKIYSIISTQTLQASSTCNTYV